VKIRSAFTFVLAAAIAVPSAMATRIHRAPTGGHSSTTKHKATPQAHKIHGQQSIDPQRVSAIQQALIREHYLSGEPTTKWDSDTQAAMLKYQADQGWQTRLMPDSRALIKLGLGPDHSKAINAAPTANFNLLASPTTTTPSTTPVQGFVAASGVSH